MPTPRPTENLDRVPTPITPIGRRERGPTTQLPVPLTSFIGRSRESAAAIDLLRSDEVRLLTLTGPGGAGKSRLALHIATEIDVETPGDVIYVALSTISNPELVLPTIANCCGIRETGGQPVVQTLGALLQRQRKLLVLDNFEQVVGAGPDLAQLMTTCPDLKLLVTSQVPLHIQGEQEFPISPLELPPHSAGTTWKIPPLDEIARYDAVALFLQRAHSVQPDFELTEANALAVIEICRRLDGLPLAIELAAARIKLLSPSALLTRLASRLGILTSGARDLPPRLQTMRAAIGWSYDLLDAEERTLFRRLSVFSGGFNLDAAASVMDQDGFEFDIFDGIASLVDKSLLRPAGSITNEPRFTMLETIREYGIEQLDEHGMTSAIRRRHAHWYAGFVAEASQYLNGREAVPWMDRLQADYDNIRAALTWLLDEGEAGTALAMTVDIWFFWFQRTYYTEGQGWLERALAQRLAEPTPSVATALCYAGLFAEAVGDYQRAINLLEEGRTIATELGDTSSLAKAILGLADVYENLEDHERAGPLFEQSAALFRETGELAWLAVALSNLGVHAHWKGDEATAQRFMAEVREVSDRAGFTWGSANALIRLGEFASDLDDFVRAIECFQQSLDLWQALGDRWRIAYVFTHLADIAARTNDPVRAVYLLAAAETLNDSHAVSFHFPDAAARQRALELAQAQLDQSSFESAWSAGGSLSLDEALTEATKPVVIERVKIQTMPPVDASHRLTARELEVLQLLVAGHSDRQIAEELFISPRTAQSHVASIFTKLGVNSRTAAATAAIRAGLVSDDTSPIT